MAGGPVLIVKSGSLQILRRLGWTFAVFALLLFLNFALIHLPGALTQLDPTSGARLSEEQREENVEAWRERFELDRPLLPRFFNWAGRALRFDFGPAMRQSRPVSEILAEALPTTLLIQGCALFLIFSIGVPFGIWLGRRADLASQGLVRASSDRRGAAAAATGSARTPRQRRQEQGHGGDQIQRERTRAQNARRADRGFRGLLYAVQSIPDFWLATLALVFLATGSGIAIFPLEGLGGEGPTAWARFIDRLHHLALPVLVLMLPGIAFLTRMTRNLCLDELQRDWVRTARAQGCSEQKILWSRVARHLVVPTVTLFGAMLPGLIAGSVVVEQIFNLPGMGKLLVDATLNRDLPVLQATLLISTALTLTAYALSDLIVALIDPRTRRPGWEPELIG